MKQILEAAIQLRDLGIVHRDFKPDNILIRTNDDICVIDFGLSGYTGYDPDMEDYLFGTIGYVAPEVFADESNCSEKLDVFSLGCIFFEIAAREQLITAANRKDMINKNLNFDVMEFKIKGKKNMLIASFFDMLAGML